MGLMTRIEAALLRAEQRRKKLEEAGFVPISVEEKQKRMDTRIWKWI